MVLQDTKDFAGFHLHFAGHFKININLALFEVLKYCLASSLIFQLITSYNDSTIESF